MREGSAEAASLGAPFPLDTLRPSAFLGAKLSPRNVPLKRKDLLERGLTSDLLRRAFARAVGGEELYSLPTLNDAPLVFDPSSVEHLSSTDQRAIERALRVSGLAELKHAAPASELTSLLRNSELVVACGETSFHNLFFRALSPSGVIFKHKAFAFPMATWGLFAVLQSAVHQSWAWRWGLRREHRLVYSAKRCATTFPLPRDLSVLDEPGERFSDMRNEACHDYGEGLTALTYRINDESQGDARIKRLRDAHVDLTERVVRAYDWTSVPIEFGFQKHRVGLAFGISTRSASAICEALHRLNSERSAKEPLRAATRSRARKSGGKEKVDQSVDQMKRARGRQRSLLEGEE
jgi:hypothetical protein